MSIGTAIAEASLGPPPANIVVKPWVSQLDVLRRTSVFVSHGGMNSVSESLHHGVPLVLVPQMGEQEIVARRVEDLGAGLCITKTEVTADVLRQSVRRVQSDERFRIQAALAGKSFAAAGWSRSRRRCDPGFHSSSSAPRTLGPFPNLRGFRISGQAFGPALTGGPKVRTRPGLDFGPERPHERKSPPAPSRAAYHHTEKKQGASVPTRRTWLSKARVIGVTLLLCAAHFQTQTTAQPSIAFDRDIRPILEGKCVSCHGGALQLSKLDLRTREIGVDGGAHGPSLVPGNAERAGCTGRSPDSKRPAMPMHGDAARRGEVAALKQLDRRGRQVGRGGGAAGRGRARSALPSRIDRSPPRSAPTGRSSCRCRRRCRQVDRKDFTHPIDRFLEQARARSTG